MGTDAKKTTGIVTWSPMRASRLLGGTGHIQHALACPHPCHEPPVGYFHPHTLPKCHHGSSAGDGSRTGHAAFPHPLPGLHPKHGRLRAGAWQHHHSSLARGETDAGAHSCPHSWWGSKRASKSNNLGICMQSHPRRRQRAVRLRGPTPR